MKEYNINYVNNRVSCYPMISSISNYQFTIDVTWAYDSGYVTVSLRYLIIINNLATGPISLNMCHHNVGLNISSTNPQTYSCPLNKTLTFFGCLTCLSLTYCLTCDSKYYLTRENICNCHCLRTIPEPGRLPPICPNCAYDCLTCDIYGNCLTCNASDFRELKMSNLRC